MRYGRRAIEKVFYASISTKHIGNTECFQTIQICKHCCFIHIAVKAKL